MNTKNTAAGFTPRTPDPSDPGFDDYVRSLSTDDFKAFLAQALNDDGALTNDQLQDTAPPQYADGDAVAFFPSPNKKK